jgi:hypothetical protein
MLRVSLRITVCLISLRRLLHLSGDHLRRPIKWHLGSIGYAPAIRIRAIWAKCSLADICAPSLPPLMYFAGLVAAKAVRGMTLALASALAPGRSCCGSGCIKDVRGSLLGP